jgi:hypothetical protein
MKRKDRKKLGPNSRPNPESTSTADQKRSITGDVHIRGEVTIETHPAEALARKTEASMQGDRDRKRLALEVLSVVVLTFYAGLTYWQARSTERSASAAESAARTAKATLDASNRSWIEARLSPPWEEESATNATAQELLSSLNQAIVPYDLTNIGHVPLTNIHLEAKVELLGQRETPHLDYSGRLITLFDSILYPGRVIRLNAVLYAPGAPSADRDVPPVEMTPLLKKELRSGQKYIAAYGRGTFNDALGEHWFHFCRWITFADPKLRLGFPSWDCVNYNAAGDGRERSK